MKKRILALVLTLVFLAAVGSDSVSAYAFPGNQKVENVMHFGMTAAEYIDRFNAKYSGIGMTLRTDPSHDDCYLVVNGERTDIRVQFCDMINGPVTTGSGLKMEEWNWLYAYIATDDYSLDIDYFASFPMLCSFFASVLGCEFTQEEFMANCEATDPEYPLMRYTKAGIENEIRFRDASVEGYHQTVYSVSIELLQDAEAPEVVEDVPIQEVSPISAPSAAEPLRIVDVAAGANHTVVLYSDGTVGAVGQNSFGTGQCNVSDWKNIVGITATEVDTIGLTADGTVISAGSTFNKINWNGIKKVVSGRASPPVVGIGTNGKVISTLKDASIWSNIKAVSIWRNHIIGLKTDGTVIAAGWNGSGQCEVSGWNDITAVSTADSHTVGLKADGTVIATGDNYYGQCNVSNWRNIVSVTASSAPSNQHAAHTAGLKSDGTVIVAGENSHGQCNVSGWTEIKEIIPVDTFFGSYVIGIRKDGTVLCTGSDSFGADKVTGWTGIIKIVAGNGFTIGLCNDGTVVAAGQNNMGQCDVDTLNAPVLAARRKTLEAVSSESVAQPDLPYTTPSGDFNYAILQNEPGYIYDKFDDYWTWFEAYDEPYLDADLIIGIQLEGEKGGSNLAAASLYTKVMDKNGRITDCASSLVFLIDGVKYAYNKLPAEDSGMAGGTFLYQDSYELIKALAEAKEVSVKLTLFGGNTLRLDLDSAQFNRTLGNICRKIVQYHIWDHYIDNPAVEILETMYPLEITPK